MDQEDDNQGSSSNIHITLSGVSGQATLVLSLDFNLIVVTQKAKISHPNWDIVAHLSKYLNFLRKFKRR